MRNVILFAVLLFMLACPALTLAQDSVGDYPLGKKGWRFDVSTSIPVMKVVESDVTGTDLDVLPVAGFGAGPCIYWTDVSVVDHKKIISFSLPFYLSTRLDDERKLDLTVAAMVEAFDGLLAVGMGYETGKLPYDRSRFVGLLSFGVKF